jgi:hypothetical protein
VPRKGRKKLVGKEEDYDRIVRQLEYLALELELHRQWPRRRAAPYPRGAARIARYAKSDRLAVVIYCPIEP